MSAIKDEYDVVGQIMAYEQGDLDGEQTVELFSHLIASGMAWELQGHYGRTASMLMKIGAIDSDGKILNAEAIYG